MTNNFIKIGKILKPRGLKGELKVEPTFFDAFKKNKSVFIGDKKFSVASVNLAQNFVYVTLDGITGIELAEELRGKDVFVERENAPKLGGDEFFIDDVVGLRLVCVSDKTEAVLGEIESVENFGGADIFFVKAEKNFSFPFIKKLNAKMQDNKFYVDGEALKEVAVYEN